MKLTLGGTAIGMALAAMATSAWADDYPSSPATSGSVQVGSAAFGALETGGDTDWFAVQLQAGTAYSFDLEGAPTNAGSLGDPYLRLYDQAGVEVASNDDGGEGFNSRLDYVAQQTGTYYLGAGAFGGSTGTYRLTAAGGSAGSTDDLAGNPGTSGAVDVGAPAFGSLEQGGDTDWFRISLVAGQTYVFDLEGQPTGVGSLSDPLLRLFDANGTEVAGNDDGGEGFNSRLEFSPSASGTYYVGAEAFGSGTGTYRLTVSGPAGGPAGSDDFAGAPGSSGMIDPGAPAFGNLEVGGDTDWFGAYLEAGTGYVFDLEGQPTGAGSLGDPLLRLFDANGNEVASNDDGGEGFNSRLEFTPSSSGNYYVSAEAFGSATGTYRLTMGAGSAAAAVPAMDLPDDGLARLEMFAAQAPDGVFDYGNGVSRGVEGFELTDVAMRNSPNDPPITIDRIVVDAFDWESVAADQPPQYFDATIDGIVVTTAAMPELSQMAPFLGDEVTLNLDVDIRTDQAQQTMDINTLVLDLVDLGVFDLAMSAAGVGPEAAMNPQFAMMGATLNSARLSYDDSGLMARAFDFAAEQEGTTADALVEEALAELEAARSMITSPQGQAIQDALVAFISDYRAPKGPIEVTLAPTAPVNMMMLMSTPDPNTLVETLGINVTY